MSKNKFFINGHLGHDGSFREVNDKIVVNFSMAEMVYLGKDKPEVTQWWDCDLWLTPAQQNYYKSGLIKGAKVFVIGFLFQDIVEKDGAKKTYYKLKVDEIEFGVKITTQQNTPIEPQCPSHEIPNQDPPF